MTKLLIILALLICTPVQAIEVDKEKHLAAGIVMGIADWKVGCGAGVLKEDYDSRVGGSAEFMDFAYTCLGSSITHIIGRDRSYFYKTAAASMLLDGLSTAGFMRNPRVREGNPFWVSFFGDKPSEKQILIMTAINLGALELTEIYLPPLSRKIAQAGIAWHRYKVVIVNFKLAEW